MIAPMSNCKSNNPLVTYSVTATSEKLNQQIDVVTLTAKHANDEIKAKSWSINSQITAPLIFDGAANSSQAFFSLTKGIIVAKGEYTITATFNDGSTASVKVDVDAYTPTPHKYNIKTSATKLNQTTLTANLVAQDNLTPTKVT
jgi:hypothetical protein